MDALERLISYIKIDTQSSEESGTHPSTEKQFDLARKLEADLKELKAAQEKIKLGVTQDEFVHILTVRKELTRLLANLKKNLLAMGHHVASNLASLDMEAAETAKNEVDKRVNEALMEMAEGRLYRGRTKKKTE